MGGWYVIVITSQGFDDKCKLARMGSQNLHAENNIADHSLLEISTEMRNHK